MTDILASIDAAIEGWEARPEAWVPGVPLHERPRGDVFEGEQYVRPMLEVVDDWPMTARCTPCQVSWAGTDTCWMCGSGAAPYATRLADAQAAVDDVRARMAAFSESITTQMSPEMWAAARVSLGRDPVPTVRTSNPSEETQ